VAAAAAVVPLLPDGGGRGAAMRPRVGSGIEASSYNREFEDVDCERGREEVEDDEAATSRSCR
jgi:hypothetical protein